MMGKLRIPKPTGYAAPGFEKVLNVFRKNYESGLETGSSFAAYYRGQPVLNIWGGLADWEVKRPWREDTMGLFHSTTKFMAAVSIAHLVERKQIRYDEKVSKYWPEFSQNGKENITVEQLIAHRAGVAALSEDFCASWMRDDPKRLHDLLAKQKPFWAPGTTRGYHPITFGLYLDEIVKRVDVKGRNLAQYFQDEIAGPFGIDFYIGCPKSLYHRVARLQPIKAEQEKISEVFGNFKGDLELYQKSFGQPKDWTSARSLNDPDFLELPLSSSHGAGTALAVAKVMGIVANGGKHEGKVLLTEDSIAQLQEPISTELDVTIGTKDIHGRGPSLLPIIEGDKSWYMFGHSGYGDQIGSADPQYKVGFAYVTNQIVPFTTYYKELNKWRPLVEALFQCIHDIEGVKVERKMLQSKEELEAEMICKKPASKL